VTDALDIDGLKRETFVVRVEHYDVLGSTNDRAKQCAGTMPPSEMLPLLVVADQQTEGRGRGSNRWWSGPGSLTFSLLLDGKSWGEAVASGPIVSLAAAVAVAETVVPLLPGRPVGIHWPNDVYAAGRKLAGILVEVVASRYFVVGIGLNVNNSVRNAPDELRESAAALVDLSRATHDRTALLAAVLRRLSELLADSPGSRDRVARLADVLCLQHGRTLTVDYHDRVVRGVCAGIAADGALLLDTAHGRERLTGGVVRVGPKRSQA
jgi:BirA family transcriptional regulator, biotin operon repressor / biotin---[acetyl-CoA-carboxylase] ligase